MTRKRKPNGRSSGQRWRDAKGKISPGQLRDEGVIDIGRARGTAVCFVRTARGLHLFHAKLLPDRALDSYAISLAVNWLELGHSADWVASNFDVNATHLTAELERAGYQRISIQDGKQRAGADRRVFRAKRKRAETYFADGRLERKGRTFRFRSTHE